MLHEQCRQETIFAQGEQILLMQGVDMVLSVLINDSIGYDEWSTFISGTNPVETEATRQTRNRSEETLEGFRKVMRNIVFVDLGQCQ